MKRKYGEQEGSEAELGGGPVTCWSMRGRPVSSWRFCGAAARRRRLRRRSWRTGRGLGEAVEVRRRLLRRRRSFSSLPRAVGQNGFGWSIISLSSLSSLLPLSLCGFCGLQGSAKVVEVLVVGVAGMVECLLCFFGCGGGLMEWGKV